MHYDFDVFLSSVKYLDREDILEATYKQHKALDKNLTGLSKGDRLDLQSSVQGLLYWIETKEKPPNMTPQNFIKLKPLSENLVKKQQLESSALEIFLPNQPYID